MISIPCCETHRLFSDFPSQFSPYKREYILDLYSPRDRQDIYKELADKVARIYLFAIQNAIAGIKDPRQIENLLTLDSGLQAFSERLKSYVLTHLSQKNTSIP